MMFETLAWDLEDRILTLRLNRPDQLKCLYRRNGQRSGRSLLLGQ